MTKGTLGIIACPMLEDEFIHSIHTDEEPKHIMVVNTGHEGSLIRKLEIKGIPYDMIEEVDFMNGWVDMDRDAYNIVVFMNNLGLHAEPVWLKDFIQDQLVMLQGRVDALGLYYGLCGNHGWDITKWADEHVSYHVAVFRDCNGRVCDDCVGVAVGGLDGYKRLLKAHTGQLLLTPAVAMNWIDFMSCSDMTRGVMPPSDDPMRSMKELFEMCGYTTAAQIDTGLADRDEFDKAVKDIVDYMEFELVQASPDLVDRGPMDRIYAECKANLVG